MFLHFSLMTLPALQVVFLTLKHKIKNTSFNDFWDWEMNLGEALANTNVNSSLSFVHKKYTQINADKYINEPVIDKSLNVNSYGLDDLLFKGLEYKF